MPTVLIALTGIWLFLAFFMMMWGLICRIQERDDLVPMLACIVFLALAIGDMVLIISMV